VSTEYWRPERVEHDLDDSIKTLHKALQACEKMKQLEAERIAFLSMKD
jgi:hypothetical protein